MSDLIMGRNIPARNLACANRSAAQEIHPTATRHVPLRNMVVTPASVPEFTIPSLCPAGCARFQTPGGRENAALVNARRHTMPRSARSSLPARAFTRRCPLSQIHDLRFADDSQGCALTDPATRAAMSLPHLSKITTPYGFLALGESPHVSRRESLFFQECLNGMELRDCTPAHASLISKMQFCSSSEDEDVVKTPALSVSREDSCNCAEQVKSTHLSKGSLRKKWLKCLKFKCPWPR